MEVYMAKTRLSNEKRDGLLAWMMKQYDEKHANDLEKPQAKAIKAMNAAIRKKYPEADMAVLRKYNATRRDYCLRFVDSDSNQIFGFDWGYNAEPAELADVPVRNGCRSDDVFPISPAGREAIEAFGKAREEAREAREQKQRDYYSFLCAYWFVEDVHDVVPLPEDMQRRYMSGSPLVAVNDELLADIELVASFRHRRTPAH
jgi:hypothetical protein